MQTQELLQLFLLALLGSIFALVGGVAFLFSRKLSKVLEQHSVPFAAAVLITVSLLGLLPEALEHAGTNALWITLVSFFGAYLFEHLLFGIHHHDESSHGKSYKSSVPLVIVGDTIHNFIDGISIGATFLVSPGLGLVTALSTFLHEIPHEIGDFGILLKAGWKRKDVLIVNVFSASTTVVGAFSLLLISENKELIGTLLAVSVGIFLYLGAIDFLPRATEGYSNRRKAIIPLSLGVIIMLIILIAVPHSDGADKTENVDGGGTELDNRNNATPYVP